MSLESVKSVVARMAREPEFKSSVVSGKESLSGYDLTVEERSAIVRLSVNNGKPKTDPLGTWV